MTEELKPSATPIQATIVPVKVWIEKDMMGTVHIKRQNEGGPAFDFIQIQYSHMHTCNAFQHGLAEQIVALLNGAALTAAQPAQAAQVPEERKLVPVEPTVEMALAGADVIRNRARGKFVRYVMHDVWAAMLAAAPQGAGHG